MHGERERERERGPQPLSRLGARRGREKRDGVARKHGQAELVCVGVCVCACGCVFVFLFEDTLFGVVLQGTRRQPLILREPCLGKVQAHV